MSGIVGCLVASGAMLSGCFYTEPINRRPGIMEPVRLCDTAHPAEPCTLANLHYDDRVMVKAVFDDPDGDPARGAASWRISGCADDFDASCDADRLFNGSGLTPEFLLRRTVGDRAPVRRIVFEIVVFDERGESSSGKYQTTVIPDEPAAPPPGSARSDTQ